MCTIVCLFVFFIFNHGVVSLFSIYEFDCTFGIFRPSLDAMRYCQFYKRYNSLYPISSWSKIGLSLFRTGLYIYLARYCNVTM